MATVKSWKTRYKWDRKSMHTKKDENEKVCIQKKEENSVKAKKIVEEENSGLTEKQRLFCIYYVKNKNATLAAIKAGYSKESAYVEGSRLLRNAKVLEEIKKIKVALNEELIIEEIEIINEYMKIAFADIGDYVEFGNEEVMTKDGSECLNISDVNSVVRNFNEK
ncbi:MAG: terminase small subunit [Terrisporobacter sp.]